MSHNPANLDGRKFAKSSNGAIVYYPKEYAEINTDANPEEWDYENAEIEWSTPDGIEIVRKIGRGKYSEVFDAVLMEEDGSESTVVVKILKPVKKRKIRREIMILRALSGGPNIIELIDVVKDPLTRTPSLVTEKVDNIDFRKLYPNLTPVEVCFYMYQVLKALDFAHSRGIMHRDVKPHNIMIDHTNRSLRLIDWGLAEFYIAGKEYNVRVASRYYKGPELLTDMTLYHYSLDIWSLGCVMAGIIFKREPFFFGSDNFDQLVQIVKVLGSADFEAYVQRYNIKLHNYFERVDLRNIPKKPWSSMIFSHNQQFCSPEVMDLIDKMLVYDHDKRISPKEAMAHPYFAAVRAAEERGTVDK